MCIESDTTMVGGCLLAAVAAAATVILGLVLGTTVALLPAIEVNELSIHSAKFVPNANSKLLNDVVLCVAVPLPP